VIFDFDKIINRVETDSVKYDGRLGYFGTEDVIPLWVADMDFSAPNEVTRALTERAKHPIYGYTLYSESLFSAMQNWFINRHHWSINRESIIMCPGVVPSLHAAILALTDEGDGIIVQSPVYFPFFSAVTKTKRSLILNPLQLDNKQYHFNLAHLEKCAAEGAKAILFCSPHNPVGRVWHQDELEAVLGIVRQYGLTIISDEIHADLIFPDQQHIPLASLATDVDIVTTVSPSKTFNIPGLGLSALVADKAADRVAINQVFDSWHVSAANPFSIAAFEAGYRYGNTWLDALMVYLNDTRIAVKDYLEQNLPEISLIDSEGTYLLWLDCRAMGLSDAELKRFFIEKASVGMSPGIIFGEAGRGFMRMNIATSRKVVFQALQQIDKAISS